MEGRFTKGLIIGSIIGASIGMMVDNNEMRRKSTRMMKNGKDIIRNINDIIKILR